MKKIAITGGIGSGKSYVCSMLRKRGFRVYDCDSAAKRVMSESADVKDKLISLLGADAYVAGDLNKSLMRKYILSNDTNAKMVNDIVHPAVAADFLSSEIQIMECAILFSSGFDKLVDWVICVSAPYEVRLARIMARDGISREKADAWIRSQMSQEIVELRSDFIIFNDGVCDIVPQLNKVIAMYFN